MSDDRDDGWTELKTKDDSKVFFKPSRDRPLPILPLEEYIDRPANQPRRTIFERIPSRLEPYPGVGNS